jgi:hypothetical protein
MYDGFYTLNMDYCNFDAADENLVFLRSVDFLTSMTGRQTAARTNPQTVSALFTTLPLSKKV